MFQKYVYVTLQNNYVFIIGKTVLLKERAACSKRIGREVCYVSLGASDERGKPLIMPLLFDLETEDENMLEGILVENAHHLCDCKEVDREDVNSRSCSKGISSSDSDDLDLVVNKYYQLCDVDEITVDERGQIMTEHGMDRINASRHMDNQKKGLIKHCDTDVFQHLLTFIRHHSTEDIFLDEVPILQNRKSKISA